MEIRLSPALAAVVEQDVASGRFASAEEYVAAAAEMLHERESWRDETPAELSASLDAAVAEADKDGWLTENEVRQNMTKMKADWAACLWQ